MFSWSDAIGVLGIIALAIVAAELTLIPKSSVVAVFAAVIAYMGARALRLRKDRKDEQKRFEEERTDARDSERDEHPGHTDEEQSDGAPARPIEDVDSGVIEVAPQASGRTVRVNGDGTVHIGPARDPSPHDEERTPVEYPRSRRPVMPRRDADEEAPDEKPDTDPGVVGEEE